MVCNFQGLQNLLDDKMSKQVPDNKGQLIEELVSCGLILVLTVSTEHTGGKKKYAATSKGKFGTGSLASIKLV